MKILNEILWLLFQLISGLTDVPSSLQSQYYVNIVTHAIALSELLILRFAIVLTNTEKAVKQNDDKISEGFHHPNR